MIKIYSILVLSLFMLTQCSDEKTFPSQDIRDGIINLDLQLGTPGINEMLEDLQPQPDTEDLIGHEDNLTTFIERLKENCDLDATLGCYGCIETFPALSHVDLTLDSAGFTIHRSLDIVTPADTVMTLRDIHQ